MGGVAANRALRIDLTGLILALALPLVLWGGTISDIAQGFRFELSYLVTGWAPWLLMLAGIVCFVPVILDRIHGSSRRFYGSGIGHWYGWSITLYLLGFCLATQVVQIAHGIAHG